MTDRIAKAVCIVGYLAILGTFAWFAFKADHKILFKSFNNHSQSKD